MSQFLGVLTYLLVCILAISPQGVSTFTVKSDKIHIVSKTNGSFKSPLITEFHLKNSYLYELR